MLATGGLRAPAAARGSRPTTQRGRVEVGVELERRQRHGKGSSSDGPACTCAPPRATGAEGGDLYHGLETIGAISTAAVGLGRGLGVLRLAGDKKYRKEKFKWPKLAASIAIDAVGVSSYAFPVVGESEDVVWAPISAALVQLIYGNYFLSALDLVEEGLPFSDIVPTASLAWALEYTAIRRAIPFLPNNNKEEGDNEKDEDKKKKGKK